MNHYYLNIGPLGYKEISEDNNYIDKTGLIHCLNTYINKSGKLVLASWPRRFGKTFSAQMLAAYYTYGYDTTSLFQNRIIHAMDPSLTYCGAFDVIYIDMLQVRDSMRSQQAILNTAATKSAEAPQLDWIDFLTDSLIQELADSYGSDIIVEKSLARTLVNTVQKTGRKIIWICDEWDSFFREPTEDPEAPRKYIEFLRSLFKVPQTTSLVFAAAYMTGILPMIKVKGESALTEFDDYTMFTPGELAPYVGFTEAEVRDLLERNPNCGITYDEMAEWYEGYSFPSAGPLFNPRSVIQAIKFKQCTSYWTDSSSNAQFKQLVSMQRKTLRQDVEKLLQGENIPVSKVNFDNDLRTLPDSDGEGDGATLAAMVHLGYLSYDSQTDCAHIPNKEIRSQFLDMLKESSFPVIYRKITNADQLLQDTLAGNEKCVAEAFRAIHHQYTDPKAYNTEATLKETLDLAYYTADRYYIRMYEIPSGEGFADVIFYPKAQCAYPLLIIELKKNAVAETGLSQIKKRNYPARFKEYGGKEILLVSISYHADKLEKEHFCKIERMLLPAESSPTC